MRPSHEEIVPYGHRPEEAVMVRRWVPLLVLGGVWWWAVLRLLLEPQHAGLVEGAVAAGGWGLSLLPVHVAATGRPARPPARADGGPAQGGGGASAPGAHGGPGPERPDS
ncbi:hypothetical protein JOF59_001074 [Streptomyces clavifer]|uniref:Integral membrane protein n=2 Tax=Streptomyces TaxID=1883 RepID=A0ABS4V4P5_9ACTN|nr:hypothetical protein [Streptomyces clavifer]